jgi:hypothetical protein
MTFWSELMNRHRWLISMALMVAALAAPSAALALTTNSGQTWDYEPDAWTRGNNADTAYFGWDVMEGSGAMLGFGRVLDDATPDLGSPTTATGTRLFQGANGAADPAPTAYGHRSGSNNYYSGFGDADVANDTVTGTAPASGTGGYTTLVLQILGGAPADTGSNPIGDLNFEMLTSGWTLAKDLYGVEATGTGVYWQEWTAPGSDLPFEVKITSATSSRSIDAVQVDTYWTSSAAGAAVVNARSSIGFVPEPTGAALATLGLRVLAARRRRG